jgi:mannose-1-phosphate guanylyltransferase
MGVCALFSAVCTPSPRSGLESFLLLRQVRSVHQAFILGAGLGTRLRPLTDRLPSRWFRCSTVPSWSGRWMPARAPESGVLPSTPTICRTLATVRRSRNGPLLAGGNGLPSSSRRWNGMEVSLFHEPVLLETGGGIKNISSWIDGRPVLVHNGDIYSSLPLEKLVAAHEASGLPATLAVRSTGLEKRVSLDPSRTRVTDLRSQLLQQPGTHVFTGIYCANADLLDRIPPNDKVQVIPAFLELAARGLLGAVVLDEGDWLDLGDRESYLRAHASLALGPAVHPQAEIFRCRSRALGDRSRCGGGGWRCCPPQCRLAGREDPCGRTPRRVRRLLPASGVRRPLERRSVTRRGSVSLC